VQRVWAHVTLVVLLSIIITALVQCAVVIWISEPVNFSRPGRQLLFESQPPHWPETGVGTCASNLGISVRVVYATRDDLEYGQYTWSAGFPMRVLKRSIEAEWGALDPPAPLPRLKPRYWREGLSMPRVLQMVGGDPNRVIPLIPVAIGWVINTSSGVVLIGAFGIGYRWLLRQRRARRGRCVDCGYILTTSSSGCPECGWNRSAERADKD
jgi:hypothetical protein